MFDVLKFLFLIEEYELILKLEMFTLKIFLEKDFWIDVFCLIERVSVSELSQSVIHLTHFLDSYIYIIIPDLLFTFCFSFICYITFGC